MKQEENNFKERTKGNKKQKGTTSRQNMQSKWKETFNMCLTRQAKKDRANQSRK